MIRSTADQQQDITALSTGAGADPLAAPPHALDDELRTIGNRIVPPDPTSTAIHIRTKPLLAAGRVR